MGERTPSSPHGTYGSVPYCCRCGEEETALRLGHDQGDLHVGAAAQDHEDGHALRGGSRPHAPGRGHHHPGNDAGTVLQVDDELRGERDLAGRLHVPHGATVLYVKFTTDVDGYLVISFKEK